MKFRYYIAALIFFAITGCSKNEKPVEEARYTNINCQVITEDVFRLKLMVDDNVVSDALVTPQASVNVQVQYTELQHRIRLVDFYTNETLIDTMVTYQPAYINTLTFFQVSANEKLVWLGPPKNEAVPPVGQLKMSVVYTYDLLPDVVKVVVENTPPTGPVSYAPKDSSELRKGEFSKYFLGTDLPARHPVLKFYTIGTPRKQVAVAESFSDTSPGFTIYLFRERSGVSNGISYLFSEKLY